MTRLQLPCALNDSLEQAYRTLLPLMHTAEFYLDLSSQVLVTWFFSLRMTWLEEAVIPYALMTSRVFPRCKCAQIMQGLWHPLPLEGCQMCLLDANGPTSSAPDLTCWEVADAHQHCTAVLPYFKSCFRVVSADLDWAEVELPGLVPQSQHPPVGTTVQIYF